MKYIFFLFPALVLMPGYVTKQFAAHEPAFQEPGIKKYAIGDTAFCGMVFYVELDSGGQQHGLVCALEDQSSSISWYNGHYSQTGATTNVLFDKDNAGTIIKKQGSTSKYAATVCDLYIPVKPAACDSGWYLPSTNELRRIYDSLAVKKKMKFAKEGYWTSVEYLKGTSDPWRKAYIIDFFDGQILHSDKANKYHVRAVKAF